MTEAKKPSVMELCKPTLTLSSTDILENRRIFWKVRAIPIRFTCEVVLPAVDFPSKIIEPREGW